jgi:Ca2+-binding EF-hand superfamily protein
MLGELLNIEVLRQIRTYFVNSGVMSGGIEALSAKDFIKTLTKYLPSSEIECLYKKIDVNDDGFVDWQEFTGFLTTPGMS